MRKLYRSRKDVMVFGVCGGLGQYLGIDSTWVRLFFFLMMFFHGVGFWVYVVLAIVVPRIPEGEEENIEAAQPRSDNPEAVKIIGGTLILFGLVALLGNLNLPWLAWFTFGQLWPLLLILFGVVLLVRVVNQED